VLTDNSVGQFVEAAALDLVADRHRSKSFERDNLGVSLDEIPNAPS
jgi:hypothetical protein